MTLPTCRWYGKAPHGGEWCPLVKAIEYHQSPVEGPPLSVKRVEFHPPDPTAAHWKTLAEHNLNELIRLDPKRFGA